MDYQIQNNFNIGNKCNTCGFNGNHDYCTIKNIYIENIDREEKQECWSYRHYISMDTEYSIAQPFGAGYYIYGVDLSRYTEENETEENEIYMNDYDDEYYEFEDDEF